MRNKIILPKLKKQFIRSIAAGVTVNNDRTLVGEGGGEEVRDEVGYREAPAPKTFADRPERSL